MRATPPRPLPARSTPEQAPLLHAFAAMGMDERWVDRSPDEMLRTFHGYQGDQLELIVEDLLGLPEDPAVLVEGFSPLPGSVAPLLSRQRHAVWLLPTPDFRIAAFEHRGSTWESPGKTSDPRRAFENLLARDALFTHRLRRDAEALGLQTIELDGSRSIEDLVGDVGKALGLDGAAGSPAS